jgi:hypothetical protein
MCYQIDTFIAIGCDIQEPALKKAMIKFKNGYKQYKKNQRSSNTATHWEKRSLVSYFLLYLNIILLLYIWTSCIDSLFRHA